MNIRLQRFDRLYLSIRFMLASLFAIAVLSEEASASFVEVAGVFSNTGLIKFPRGIRVRTDEHVLTDYMST